MSTIDPSLAIDSVSLAVSDLGRSSDFYSRILGLEERGRDDGRVLLGAPGSPRAALELTRLVEPADHLEPGRAGLFHVAWLHPTRAGLAATVRRIAGAGWPLEGASDHGVSEALYLSDPDGLGIEVYSDRPRELWERGPDGQGVRMVTLALDLEDLLAQAPAATATIEPGTGVGHVHLKVSDVERAAAFYGHALGFEEMARLPAASFLSAGGYHHHIGLNSWQSRGGRPPAERAPGLRRIDFLLGSEAAVEQLAEEIQGEELIRDRERLSVRDPDGERLTFAPAPGD